MEASRPMRNTQVDKRCLVLGLALLPGGLTVAEDTGPPELQEIVVVGTTPVPGMTVNADKVPGNVQTLTSKDLAQNGFASLTGGMSTRLASVNINDTLADPFQPD